MKSSPFFSIIIPSYQSSEFLSASIKSVLNQGFKDYELIIVDDGSDDYTDKIIRGFNEFSEIHCFYTKHLGTQHARYYGANKSKGYYLIFLDSDDELLNDSLQVIYNSIKKCEVDIYIGGMICKNDKDSIVLNTEYKEGYINKNELFCDMIDKRIIKSICRKVIRRECALYNSSFIKNNSMDYAEDMLYSIDILLETETILYSNTPFYLYKIRKGSKMNSFYTYKYKDRLLMSRAIMHYGELLGVEKSHLSYISNVYLLKELLDCIIEVENNILLNDNKGKIIDEIIHIIFTNIENIDEICFRLNDTQKETLQRIKNER